MINFFFINYYLIIILLYTNKMNKNLELINSEINNLNILSKMNNIDEIIKRSSILIKKYPQIQIFYNFLGSSLEKKIKFMMLKLFIQNL